MSDWILVIAALFGGLIVGLVASRIVYAVIGSPKRPEAIQNVAKPLASLALSVGIVLGLVVALGIVQPDSLDKLKTDAIDFIPKLMTAAIIIIAANVLSSFATTAMSQALGRLPLQTQRQANSLVKGAIVTLAALLAVSQLGINTDVVNLGVAAVFFGIAASLTLLVGLGGNGVAREVAATRALKRLISQGDTVEVGGSRGVVLAIHPTAVELSKSSGETMLIPSSRFVRQSITVERVEGEAPADS
ncbi:MAG: mechanosensitive ion channel domain-containing protein [Acidimicrobiales bacterium]